MRSEKGGATKIQSFTDLLVWQKAHALALFIYKITLKFPNDEKFGLTSQMRRAAVSVPSNLAEGFYRKTGKDKSNFYNNSLSSLGELYSQSLIARDLDYLSNIDFRKFSQEAFEVKKMLNRLIFTTNNR